MANMKKAMLTPDGVFNDLKMVVISAKLPNEQKVTILRDREYDAHQMEVAEEESEITMNRPEMFDLVVKALHTLVFAVNVTARVRCQVFWNRLKFELGGYLAQPVIDVRP